MSTDDKPQWFTDLTKTCLRCGRPCRWVVRLVGAPERHYGCHYHLEYVINHVLAPLSGTSDVVVSKLD